jgi:2-polyprenyl-3-methyl-5-hydroxy-6-metoxy-1,4-benzoquinol methylase
MKLTDGAMPAEVSAPPAEGDRLEAIRAGRTVLSCDAPDMRMSGVPLTLPIRVCGWAYSRSGLEGVVIGLDEQRIPARSGLHREDVAALLDEPGAVACGFTAVLGEDICDPGPHTLSVLALNRERRAVQLTTTIIAEASETDPPAPEAVDGGAEHDEIWSERYVPELHRDLPMGAEHQSRYSWAAPLAAGRDVLDAGCGVGWGALHLSRAGARNVVGLDVDERALENARKRAGASAAFVRGDLLALPFDDGSFDLVVCFEAIEHVSDPERALTELRRVMRPEGILVISSPNRGVYATGNPFHVHEFTSAELEERLAAHFRFVRAYRQQTHTGSLLTDDRGHAEDDPGAEIDVRLHKLSGGQPGDELYTVALAGDIELPPMQSVVVLTAPANVNRLLDQIDAREQRALLAEAQRATARGEARVMQDRLTDADRARWEADRACGEAMARQHDAERWLEELRHSLSWRITRPLRSVKQTLRGPR